MRVDRALPIAGVTKRASESKDIGAHEQQSRNVRRFERPGQAAHQVERAALRAELVKLHDLEMRDEAATSLVTRVEHRALEAQLPEFGEESEIGLFVSEHHADKGYVASEPAQRLTETMERWSVNSKFDVIDTHRRQRPRAREQRFFIIRRVAERRARFASSRDCGDRLARNIERDGSERAPPRVLQIDDVGDTGEHARHRVASYSPQAPKFRQRARLPTPNGAKGDASVHFGGLIGRKPDLIITLERKRKCILRPAPFSRLRSWPHWRRRRSLNLRERRIQTGPASRSRRRLFRSPRSGPGLSSI